LTPVPDDGFSVELIGSMPVVAAPEDIDISNAAGLRVALLQAAASGHGRFVVDLSRTQFCDTAGLHALVGAHKRALAEGGQVVLVICGGAVQRIFSMTGLDSVIPYFPSLEQALRQTPATPAGPNLGEAHGR
jgi:anti-sigma B factor antagonist